MFGDYDFYGKPYEFARKKMELWLKENEQNGKKIVILEIGCGINPHSLRMYNGKMMSGEWKLPKMNTIMKTIRLNPDDDIDNTCIQIGWGKTSNKFTIEISLKIEIFYFKKHTIYK